MVPEIDERIADRNATAAERLREQGPVARGMNHVGRVTANTMDRVSEPAKSHTGAFAGGAILGALEGAGLGAAAWIVMFGAFGLLPGMAAALTVVAVGAAVMSVYEGNQAVKRRERKAQKNTEPLSNRVAEVLGTVEQGHGEAPERQDPIQEPSFIQRLERERRREQRRENHHHH